MRVVLFYHSILSCWNHGNAHFLRGCARELARLGHEVIVYEPEDGWSRLNALADAGPSVLRDAHRLLPGVQVVSYKESPLDLARATDRADLVIVHEWNTPALIAALGRQRATGGQFTLFFHDTHHRAATAESDMSALDLDGYDGVLAFGEVLRQVYLGRGWARRVFTWHEAADTALFHPLPATPKELDLVWIGNWGDDERRQELYVFLLEPIRRLRLRAAIHGVRYPADVTAHLEANGIAFNGWLPNHRVPATFAGARATVHVPRRPYTGHLPGIPTIRVFEALACGIPLVCSPWLDDEGLFPPQSFLTARNTEEMISSLSLLLRDHDFATSLVATGLRVVHERHTCAHRVRELFAIVEQIQSGRPGPGHVAEAMAS